MSSSKFFSIFSKRPPSALPRERSPEPASRAGVRPQSSRPAARVAAAAAAAAAAGAATAAAPPPAAELMLPDLDDVVVDDAARQRRVLDRLEGAARRAEPADARASGAAGGRVGRGGGRGAAAAGGGVSLTPLEAQVLELKARVRDTLLLVENGYRMTFFGADAVAAARVLSIYHHRQPERFFRVASVPVHRTGVAVRRLVEAGHRVGVVRQAETAAVKAAGLSAAGKSGPFARALAGVYSPGTLLDDDVIGDGGEDAGWAAAGGGGASADAAAAQRWVVSLAAARAPSGAPAVGWVAVSLPLLSLRFGVLGAPRDTTDAAGAGAACASASAAAALAAVLRALRPVEIVAPPPSVREASRGRADAAADDGHGAATATGEGRSGGGAARREDSEPLPLPPDCDGVVTSWAAGGDGDGGALAEAMRRDADGAAAPAALDSSEAGAAAAAAAAASAAPPAASKASLYSYAFSGAAAAAARPTKAATAAPPPPSPSSFFGFPAPPAHVTSGDELVGAGDGGEDGEAGSVDGGGASGDDEDEAGDGGSGDDDDDDAASGRGGEGGAVGDGSDDADDVGSAAPRGAATAPASRKRPRGGPGAWRGGRGGRGGGRGGRAGARGSGATATAAAATPARTRVERLPLSAFRDARAECDDAPVWMAMPAVTAARGGGGGGKAGATVRPPARVAAPAAAVAHATAASASASATSSGTLAVPPWAVRHLADGGVGAAAGTDAPLLRAWRAGGGGGSSDAALGFGASGLPAPCRSALAGLARFLAPYGRAPLLLQCAVARGASDDAHDDDGGGDGGAPAASPTRTLRLPATTLFDLDVLAERTTGSARASLLGCLNHCATPFGLRALRGWLAAPLADADAINARLDAVEALAAVGDDDGDDEDAGGGAIDVDGGDDAAAAASASAVQSLRRLLRGCPDLDRLLARVASGHAQPPHVVALVTRLMAVAATVGRGVGAGGGGQPPAADSASTAAAAAPTPPLRRVLMAFPPALLSGPLATGRGPPLSHLREGVLPPTAADAAAALLPPRRGDGRRDGGRGGGRGGPPPPQHLQLDGVFAPAAEAALFPALTKWRAEAAAVAAALDQELAKLRVALRKPALAWTSLRVGATATLHFLVELPRSALESALAPLRVPDDFIEVSRTKALARFRSPAVNALVARGDVARDMLRTESAAAWRQWLVGTLAPALRAAGAPAAVAALARLDALASLAVVSRLPGWVRPVVVGRDGGPPELTIASGRHPVMDAAAAGGFGGGGGVAGGGRRPARAATAPAWAKSAPRGKRGGASNDDGGGGVGEPAPPPLVLPVMAACADDGGGGSSGGGGGSAAASYVPTDFALGGATAARVCVLTGPNAGGKSTCVRMAACVAVLAHVGSFVPAAAATVGVLDTVLTRMGATDDLAAGASSFGVECAQTAAVLAGAAARPRALLLLDELGRGTSTFDGTALAAATLRYVAATLGPRGTLAVFITHYPELARLAADPALRIASATAPAGAPAAATAASGGAAPPLASNAHMAYVLDPRDGALTFLYTLAPGPADASFGLNVARAADVPASVLALAAAQAARMEHAATAAAARAAGGAAASARD